MTRDDEDMHYVTVAEQIDTTTPEGMKRLEELCERENAKRSDDDDGGDFLDGIDIAKARELVQETRALVLDEEICALECDRKVQAALDRIEEAQRQLEWAAQELSGIVGAAQQTDRVASMRTRVHELWRRIAYGFRDKKRGKLNLDSYNRKPFLDLVAACRKDLDEGRTPLDYESPQYRRELIDVANMKRARFNSAIELARRGGK